MVESKEYEIYAGIGNSDTDVELVTKSVFNSDKEARDYAEYEAFGIYNFNPKRDIFEIMKEDNVDEDEALAIFKREAEESIISFAIEYDEDEYGRIVATRHY